MNKPAEEYEDTRLLPCALCKGKAYYRIVTIGRGANRTGKMPEGAKITEEKKTCLGGTLYYWERPGFSVHCMTKNCGCRTTRGFKTLDEAVANWNTNR